MNEVFVDSYLLLGGFFMHYTFAKSESSNIRKCISFCFHRYARLTPSLALTILVFCTSGVFLTQGIFAIENESWLENCRENWWENLVYLNNFETRFQMCYPHTWYLAVDMQFYAFSLILYIIIKRWPNRKYELLTCLVLSSWITTGLLCFWNYDDIFLPQIPGTDLSRKELEKSEEMYNDVLYDKPHTRLGPYLVGFFLADIYLEQQNKKILLSRWHALPIWTITVGIIWIIAFEFALLPKWGRLTFTLVFPVYRTIWAAVLAWIVYACFTGNAGPITRILSLKFWIPLSRLSYSVYLVHMPVLMWYFTDLEKISPFSYVRNAFWFIIFSLIVASLLTFTCEIPLQSIEKLLTRKQRQHSRSKLV